MIWDCSGCCSSVRCCNYPSQNSPSLFFLNLISFGGKGRHTIFYGWRIPTGFFLARRKEKNKKCLLAHVGRRKKINGRFSEFYLFLTFFSWKVYTKRETFCHVGGENKIKTEWSIFFLAGPDSSSSEESSTVEYSVRALKGITAVKPKIRGTCCNILPHNVPPQELYVVWRSSTHPEIFGICADLTWWT